jgi:hypothetical protein
MQSARNDAVARPARVRADVDDERAVLRCRERLRGLEPFDASRRLLEQLGERSA